MADYRLAPVIQSDKQFLGNFEAGDTILNDFGKPIVIARLTFDSTEEKYIFVDELNANENETCTLANAGAWFIIDGANSYTNSIRTPVPIKQ